MKALLIASTAAATLALAACGGDNTATDEQGTVTDTGPVVSEPLATDTTTTPGMTTGATWDTDGDGMLSQAEYTTLRDRGMADWDTDQDGTLTQDEFDAGASRAGINNGPALFTALDTNGDGSIGTDEWFSEASWTKLDANKSGILENDELRTS